MRYKVEFISKKFPSYQSEEEGVNYHVGVYGKRLAEYLKAKLTLKGIDVRTIYPEDWGWCVEINHSSDFLHFIGCSCYDEAENGFICFLEPNKPFIKKWFRKIDVSATLEKSRKALDEILHEDKDIENIQWLDDE